MTTPPTPTAVAEAELARLIPAFYDRVRADPLLAPLFDAAVDDWPAHLTRLTDFWSSVMLGSGRYKGNPVARHLEHRAAMTPEQFTRWLALWRETTDAMMPEGAARLLQDKAERIAESLRLALWFRI